MKVILIMVFFLVLSIAVEAQPAEVQPQNPVWNDSLLIKYNPLDSMAQLSEAAQIYARIVTYMQDGSFEKYNVLLQSEGGVRRQYFIVPVHTASIRVQFYTLNMDDENATTELLVYTINRSTPVEGAYMNSFFDDNPATPFAKEIQNYPQNYLAYAKYFNTVAMIKPHDSAEFTIKKLLTKMDGAYNTKNSPPGLLAALCIGNAKTDNLPTAKKYLFDLFKNAPEADETAFAFGIYNYEYYKASGKDIEDDVKDGVKKIFIHYPQSALAADNNVFYYLEKDTSIRVENFEHVFLPAYNSGKVEYYALGTLATLYIERNTKIDSARAMLKTAIARFNNANINHQYWLSPSRYKMYVGSMLVSLTKADMLLKDYDDAIVHASAAVNFVRGSNLEGNLTNDILQLRASAYQRLYNVDLAMEDYKTLYKNGYTGAKDSMAVIFPFCSKPQKDFADFITSLNGVQAATTASTLPPAPDFTGIGLNGDTVRLSALKGKIVVLNYWGTGCGPCVAEMPKLNELVSQNKGRGDVVFLAATLDEKDRLSSFFINKKFDYKVFMATNSFTKDYNIDALPVHFVIGKDGGLLSRSVGSRPDIKEYLQGIIDRGR